MGALFLELVNMTIAASWMILAVVLLRLIFRRGPKNIRCILWALVALRLVCPFTIESALSLIPSAETLPPAVIEENSFDVNTGFEAVDVPINDYIGDHYYEGVTVPVDNGRDTMDTLGIVWLVGAAAMLIYCAVSYFAVKRRVSASLKTADGVWLCDEIDTPFILGVLAPRIYMPSNMQEDDARYAAAHERMHISRGDHVWKLLGFIVLAIHWFNPLVWLGFVLFSRDMELACDERVIKNPEIDKKAYSEALLACSTKRRAVFACPVAFGELGVKERIKVVLNYKKPAFWITLAAIVVCIVVAVCFLTSPAEEPQKPDDEPVETDDILSPPSEMPETNTSPETVNPSPEVSAASLSENQFMQTMDMAEYVIESVIGSDATYTQKGVSILNYPLRDNMIAYEFIYALGTETDGILPRIYAVIKEQRVSGHGIVFEVVAISDSGMTALNNEAWFAQYGGDYTDIPSNLPAQFKQTIEELMNHWFEVSYLLIELDGDGEDEMVVAINRIQIPQYAIYDISNGESVCVLPAWYGGLQTDGNGTLIKSAGAYYQTLHYCEWNGSDFVRKFTVGLCDMAMGDPVYYLINDTFGEFYALDSSEYTDWEAGNIIDRPWVGESREFCTIDELAPYMISEEQYNKETSTLMEYNGVLGDWVHISRH